MMTTHSEKRIFSELYFSLQTSSQNLPGWLDAINGINSLFLTIGPGDFLVHHAFLPFLQAIHTTVLICVKGALDARGTKLMPDKKDFGFAFPCDGLGRGDTCQTYAWQQSFFLAI